MDLDSGGRDAEAARRGLSLLELCVIAACRDKHSVGVWRRQRRTLARLPSQLAEPLLHRLLQARLLTPPLLELFQYSVVELELSGEGSVDAEWMAYVGGFRHLRVLRAADCKLLTNNAIWHLAGLPQMEELELARCRKVSDESIRHIVSLAGLKKLGLAGTGVGPTGLGQLSILTALTSLDLGGCPVSDIHLSSLQALKQLEHLDLWGSNITNTGALLLQSSKFLKTLNLALTPVTVIPSLHSLTSLNLCNCTVDSIFRDWENPNSPLRNLYLSRAVLSPEDALGRLGMRRVLSLDLSESNVKDVDTLVSMQELTALDLSSTGLLDNAMPTFAKFGTNLLWLNLSHTKVGSQGIGALTGNVPKLEQLSLSSTLVDDSVFAYLALMPLLHSVDLSSTAVKGTTAIEAGEGVQTSVLLHLRHLQALRRLDLERTGITDIGCEDLASLKQLTHLYLHSNFLSDACLQPLSSLSNLLCLGIQGAVISDTGLCQFSTPPLLQEFDLSDCWLLSKEWVLSFCKAHPQVIIWNDYNLVSIGKPPKSLQNVASKEFADVVGAKKFHDFRVTGSARLKPGEFSVSSLKTQSLRKPAGRGKVTAGSSDSSGGSSSRPTSLLDERLRYRKHELLQLQYAPLSSMSATSLQINKEVTLLESVRPR